MGFLKKVAKGAVTALDVVGSGGVTQIAGSLLGIVDDMVEDKDLKQEQRHELRLKRIEEKVRVTLADMQLQEKELSVIGTQLEAQGAVNLADAKSEKWYQNAWRPAIAIMLAYIVVDYYTLHDKLQWIIEVYTTGVLTPMPPSKDISPVIYLLGGLLGVYVPARSGQKMLQTWVEGKAKGKRDQEVELAFERAMSDAGLMPKVKDELRSRFTEELSR